MKYFLLSILLFILNHSIILGQESFFVKFKKLSSSEKCWVIFHPFVAKKAFFISETARVQTKQVIKENILKGTGNGGQVDAFRHAFWMAHLTQNIGWRRSRRLGVAHEKGNYKDYKKNRFEEGGVPDKISSEMDLFNNDVGIQIGKITSKENIKIKVVEAILLGECKIIKKDEEGSYLDINGIILSEESIKGTWENEKCLVWSNF